MPAIIQRLTSVLVAGVIAATLLLAGCKRPNPIPPIVPPEVAPETPPPTPAH